MTKPKKNELMDTCKVAITQALGANKGFAFGSGLMSLKSERL